MSDPRILLLTLALNGLVFGMVVGQLVRFRRRGGKLSAAWDERPVSRLLLTAVALAGLILLTRLVALDLNTRECLEDTREALISARLGDYQGPLTIECQ